MSATHLLGLASSEEEPPFDEMFEPCQKASHARGAKLVARSKYYASKAPQSVPASQTASSRTQKHQLESFVGPTEFSGSHDHLWRSVSGPVAENAVGGSSKFVPEEAHLSHVRKGWLFATGGSSSGPSTTLSFLQQRGHSAGGVL